MIVCCPRAGVDGNERREPFHVEISAARPFQSVTSSFLNCLLRDCAEVWQITPRPYLLQKDLQAYVPLQENQAPRARSNANCIANPDTQKNAFTPPARHGNGAASWNRLNLSEVRRGIFLAETRKCVGPLGGLSLKCVERAQ